MRDVKECKNELVNLNYYEYDNAFYSHGLNMSCFEQAKYQSLRKYNIDFFLFFCDDINIRFSEEGKNIFLKVNKLNYNKAICEYRCVTKNNEEAERHITNILKKKTPVVFRTALDSLRTYSWYHTELPYTRTRHYSLIVGEDENNFFYVDIPPIRNQLYFRPHPMNKAVGCIERKELLAAFAYSCEIGYMDVDGEHIQNVANIDKILKGIVQNYYSSNTIKNENSIGKCALYKLVEWLKNFPDDKNEFLDEFVFEVLASRHAILKRNLCAYEEGLGKSELIRVVDLLDELTCQWRVIRNIILKNNINSQYDMCKKIAKVIEQEILPATEELMQCLKKL